MRSRNNDPELKRKFMRMIVENGLLNDVPKMPTRKEYDYWNSKAIKRALRWIEKNDKAPPRKDHGMKR